MKNYIAVISSFILLILVGAVSAQDKSKSIVTTPTTAPTVDAKTNQSANPIAAVAAAQQQDAGKRYRIGVGDELDIQVFRHPEYSQTVRVNEFGVIMMPRVDEPVQVVCKTENEVSTEIIKQYSKYLRQPFVRVQVKDYKSQPVAIIGAVDKPGQLYINRKMRLMEVVALAGGPTKDAGARIQLARLGSISACDNLGNQQTEEIDLSKNLYSYNLKNVLEGDETANPLMQPGDIVRVLEADKAFVVGNVKEPKAIQLKTQRTVTQAIAEAGGILTATKKKEVFLIHQDDAGNKTKTVVNLLAVGERKAVDPILQPNDIIEVRVDGATQTRNAIIKGLSGGLGSLPFLIR